MTDMIDPDSIIPENSGQPENILPVDLDGDGIPDAIAADLDLDGDGVADVHELAIDVDGDGTPDILIQTDAAQDIWGDLDAVAPSVLPEDVFGAMAAVCDELVFPGYADLMATSGTPDADMALWDPQDDPMSCAVATTNMMFRSVGVDIGEDTLADAFQKYDVYDPMEGTKVNILDNAINIFAANNGLNIQAEGFSNGSIDQLETMLEYGVRPLIAVDGPELQAGGIERFLNDIGLLPRSGHAVQLIGITHSPDGDFAVINDPWYPDGAGVHVPMDAFKDAWDDMDNSGVAMSDPNTMASLHEGLSESETGVRLGSITEPLRADVFNNVYRGNSPFPISKPGGGWMKLGDKI